MELTIALFFGLCIGSFLNVCIARLPLEISVVSPRSRCPKCKKLIVWYDNIPVLSYLLLRARCRKCGVSISSRYPAVEALTGVVSLLLALRYGFGPMWALYLGFAASMIVLTLIDLDHRILPDVITLNGIWIGVAVSLYLALPSLLASRLLGLVGLDVSNPRILALTASLAGVAFGGGLLWIVREAFFRVRGIEGMGLGDVKMMAMVGAFLGLPLTLLTILLGSVAGSVIGLTFIRLFGKSREYELPFGTFLGIGAVISVLYGNDLIAFYIENFFPQGP
jgi:leader peptidase (prepilin peptidase)/N-methyltransferase